MTDEQLLVSNDAAPIIMRYMSVITAKAKLFRNNRIDVEDLISEGLIGLLNAIRSFSEDKGSFKAFANVCISNRMKTAVVRTTRTAATDMPEHFSFDDITDTNPGTEDLIIMREQKNEMIDQIKGVLSELESEVFFLYLSSYSYGQISEKLGISCKAVDNALTRAKAKLKKFFLKQES